MDEHYQQLIDTLATKLGTTAEHLWDVLIRQAPISGAVDLVLCVSMLVAAWRLIVFVKRKTTVPKKTEHNKFPYAEWGGNDAMLGWGAALCMAAVAVFYTLSSASTIIAAFVNPEYWALKELLQ